jgi:cytochrome P450
VFEEVVVTQTGTTVGEPASEVYYDPYDFEIDADPYPIWKRLRDEQPLYYNEKFDFYALSRFADVDACSTDWRTYISSRGTLIELIKANVELPKGSIIFEDPPTHDLHRALLARVFRPKVIADLAPKIREFCAQTLDPHIGTGGFDFIRDLGAQMPMRTIGMLVGIPEKDQEAIRDKIDTGLRLTDSGQPVVSAESIAQAQSELFADYVDWRAKNPSDDLMTELMQAEFKDEDGVIRRLSREEVLNYINLVAAAGNETTTRLIGWTGKVLAEHPDQLSEVGKDRSLIPSAIEELLRYESPSPVQARYVTREVEHYGTKVPEGSVMALLTASANRDDRKFPDGDQFDIHRKIDRHAAFGYGVHFCMGAALARLEGQIALDEVLNRFPSWRVDYENAEQARTSTVRGWERLPVFTD